MSTQLVSGHSVRIMRCTNGMRNAVIDNAYNVPIEMLPLTAGKDVWMREIKVSCEDCKTPTRAGDMECNMCPACYEQAGEENARQDRGE